MASRRFRVRIGFVLVIIGALPAACTSTDELLSPSGAREGSARSLARTSGVFANLLSPDKPIRDTQTTSALALQQTASALLVSHQEKPERIRLMPLLTMPSDNITFLIERLYAQAPPRHLVFVTADADAGLTMLGQLSAVQQEASVKVAYVWELIDSEGRELHRLMGTQSAPAEAGSNAATTDVWDLVPPELMQRVADETVEGLIRWLPSSTYAAAP
ncbi:hypothetical protein [Limoniibacter endophyticus]|uniref:Uncharacterized protein n=1 Tax=Limoniibacter endophyticus TaxID=1565040 RepID=A0A8J3DMV4_9HYPH|nr:hypothetical protein [Limoniibacter endophyticus]GHC65676.1 hypothetical protein GCM10010136_08540 [Limoniibacter endophyticus]